MSESKDPAPDPAHVHGPGCDHDHGPGEEDAAHLYDPNAFLRHPVVRTQPRVGRNDPCPCGSGKKYKKCHGG